MQAVGDRRLAGAVTKWERNLAPGMPPTLRGILTLPLDRMTAAVDTFNFDNSWTTPESYARDLWTLREKLLPQLAEGVGSADEVATLIGEPGDGTPHSGYGVRLSTRSDEERVPLLEAMIRRTTVMQASQREGSMRLLRSANDELGAEFQIDVDVRMEQFLREQAPVWADEPNASLGGQTPRQAIATRESLERVRDLVFRYQTSETALAAREGRPAISYQCLWDELGI